MIEAMPDAHSDRDHAEFSPSALKYIAGCAGYHGREGTSAAAEKGTRIHEALEINDTSNLESEEEISIFDQIVEEEQSFLTNYAQTGRSQKEDFKEVQLTVELEGTGTWGTCDRLTVFDDNTGILADYKTGISIIDPPEKNWQAQAYTVGAFQKFKDLKEIIFVFYVPVRNETLFYKFTRDDVPALVRKLSEVIKKGEQVRPKWETGTPELSDLTPTVNCRFCRHEDACPALGGLVISVAKKINAELPDVDINSVEDPEVIEQLWLVAKMVSNWADQLKKRAIGMAKDGVEFPSLRLRSMGAPKKVEDNMGLVAIAEQFGMSAEEVIESANLPLSKIAKALGEKAEKGEKKKISQEFVDACIDAGIVTSSQARHTLA